MQAMPSEEAQAQGRAMMLPLNPGIPEKDLYDFGRALAITGGYELGPDSLPKEGVPTGSFTDYEVVSELYGGSKNHFCVYAPAQYDPAKPTPLMVFLDGAMYIAQAKVNVVFDNLIAEGRIPVMLGVFVDPGDRGTGGLPGYGGSFGGPGSNRSREYDSVDDVFARFLDEELLPIVAKDFNITDDPEGRGICGISSGGICSFNTAWQRPNSFRKVVSHCGSFTDMLGGNCVPVRIRKMPKKPIRMFLQDGCNDLDLIYGNWPLANQEMAKALEYSGYDYKFVYGEGGHTLDHGASILPETLEWLWRDYPKG